MTVSIRVATAADLPAISALGEAVNALHHAAWPQVFTPPGDALRHAGHWRAGLSSDRTETWVAEDDAGGCVGFVNASLQHDDHPLLLPAPYARVGSLAVASGHQGRGVGSALMRAAEDWARARGASDLRLNVWAFNQRAQRLYARLGYTRRAESVGKSLTPAPAVPAPVQPLHVGILACSAEGAALCLRTLCAEGAALIGTRHAHPPVSLHAQSLALYVAALERGDDAAVGALMLDSAQRLAAAGADFIVCPDNTIHQADAWFAPRSPLPWLHIAQVVADAARAQGHRRVGLMGTRWLVDGPVYPPALAARGIDCLRCSADDRDAVDRIIFDELVPTGRAKPASVARLRSVVDRYRDRGCDAVVLGCTELPLVLHDASLPLLDSTRLLARAALRRACAGVAPASAPARVSCCCTSRPGSRRDTPCSCRRPR